MPEKWTGNLIGKMHNASVTYDELAAEMGVGKSYVCAILNSRRKPDNARARCEDAFSRIMERRKANDP